jgi:hypothetical protein
MGIVQRKNCVVRAKWAGLAAAILLAGVAAASVSAAAAAVTAPTLTWASPHKIARGSLGQVSCTTHHFCAAVLGYSHVLTLSKGTWTNHSVANWASRSVSCVSPSFCMAVGYGHSNVWSKWNGTRWTSPRAIANDTGGTSDVACTSSSFCMEIDDSGFAYVFDGSTWTSVSGRMTGAGGEYSLWHLSCPTVTYCLADSIAFGPPTNRSHLLRWNGTSWSSLTMASTAWGPLSCRAAARCVVAVGGSVRVVVGTTWQAAIKAPVPIQDLSCVPGTVNYCVAAGPGRAAAFNGHLWSRVKRVTTAQVSGRSAALMVSCPTSAFTVAVDTAGEAITGHE